MVFSGLQHTEYTRFDIFELTGSKRIHSQRKRGVDTRYRERPGAFAAEHLASALDRTRRLYRSYQFRYFPKGLKIC